MRPMDAAQEIALALGEFLTLPALPGGSWVVAGVAASLVVTRDTEVRVSPRDLLLLRDLETWSSPVRRG